MRCALMWSGGKDSALAAHRARRDSHEIACLVNFYDEETGRVRFHATRAELIAAQADAMGVPLLQRGTTWPGFETAFRETLDTLARDGIEGIVFGDIHLADVRAWYETRVRAAGLAHVEPLWGEAPRELLEEFVATGGRAVVTCCELDKLDESWLGRVIDERFVREIVALPIDPCGENGEYHSFAFAGPLFFRPVPHAAGERRSDGRFVQLDLLAGSDARRKEELGRDGDPAVVPRVVSG
jgi:diphthine-ammonia ligase